MQWKRVACWGSFLAFASHVALKVVSLGPLLFESEGTPFYHITVHLLLAIAGVMITHWYYLHCIYQPEIFAAVSRMTLRGICGGRMRTTRRIRISSIQEFMATYMPELALAGLTSMAVASLCNPNAAHFLYSALPTPAIWKSSWICTALVCLLEERYIFYLGGVCVPVWQLHLISFDLILNTLHSLKQLQRNSQGFTLEAARDQVQRLRALQLYVDTFNIVSRYAIFSWKLEALYVSIFCCYAAIAHFGENIVFGVMHYVGFLDTASIYVIMYEKGFAVSDSFENAITSMELHVGLRLPKGPECAELQKRLRSIRPVGVKVGEFHMLERASTPIFVNFVTTNVVNMLVAYA